MDSDRGSINEHERNSQSSSGFVSPMIDDMLIKDNSYLNDQGYNLRKKMFEIHAGSPFTKHKKDRSESINFGSDHELEKEIKVDHTERERML